MDSAISLAGAAAWVGWAMVAAVLGLAVAWGTHTLVGRRPDSGAGRARTPGQVEGQMSRTHFELALSEAALRCDDTQGVMTLLFIDIDHFAEVNETPRGHALGDEVLLELSARLRAQAPQQIAAMRLGGDEFLLLMPCDLPQAEALAADLLAAVSQPLRSAPPDMRLTASIGIAAYPIHGAHARLPVLANSAMRAVKHAGGNAWAVFAPQMASDQRAQAVLLADLRQAVAQHEFELVYQPKVDALSLEITAAEALLRWHHPRHGVISPAIFIPLAERYGLIGEIGNWVIEAACQQAGRWRAEGLRMRVAINLSAYQMRQDDLVPRIEAALRAHKLQPGRFTVEITETLALENTQATLRTFQRLRRAGLHVAIDDFGAGQTSLASLHQLPASELKLDMSLVRDIETSADARAVAEAVIKLARTLKRRVVAEGVETVAQRDWLVQTGCDELQGYLFAKPMPARHLSLWAQGGGPECGRGQGFRASLFKDTNAAVV